VTLVTCGRPSRSINVMKSARLPAAITARSPRPIAAAGALVAARCQFVNARLPKQADLAPIWPGANLNGYRLIVICAITGGEGAGPQTMVDSEYYEVPLDPVNG
jgi:hypothetical protein